MGFFRFEIGEVLDLGVELGGGAVEGVEGGEEGGVAGGGFEDFGSC